VIVRISGVGQYELDDTGVRKLDELDTQLTNALNEGQEQRFHDILVSTIEFIRQNGIEVSDETIVPSDVIVPPDDVTMEEARQFFTDEGLMAPLPA
jgi:hypothetical protein